MSSKVLKARSALGVASRAGAADSIKDARRELAAAKLEAYIEKTIASAPPLTPEQLDRIAVILRPTSSGLPQSSSFRGRASTDPARGGDAA